jgi:hypothetical protein
VTLPTNVDLGAALIIALAVALVQLFRRPPSTP